MHRGDPTHRQRSYGPPLRDLPSAAVGAGIGHHGEVNENLPEPGADGAAGPEAAPEPVATPDPEPVATPEPEPEPVPAAELVPAAGPEALASSVDPEPPTGIDAEVPPDAAEVPADAGEVPADVAEVPADAAEAPATPADVADVPSEAGPGPGPAPAPAARRQNRVAVIATVALVVVLAFGGGFAAGRFSAPAATSDGTAAATGAPGTPDASGATGSATPGESAVAEATPVPSGGPSLPSDGARLGKADAPVVINYWADYQCPFCGKFATEVIPQLYPQIEDGTVQLVHRDFAFIGPESTQAAIAVRCADREGKYWWMHDAVYAAQDGENKGAFSNDKLTAIAGSIGLDTKAFAACLSDHQVLVDVLADTGAGYHSGVQSTPTIDVNGTRLLGVPDMSSLSDAIAAVVAGATPAPLPTRAPTDDPWTGVNTSGRQAGSTQAPVRVELWMDYQSTDSASVAKDLEPELRSRVQSGAIQVVQRDLALLGDESITASAAVRCTADQDGPTWLMHDILAVNAKGAGSGIYITDVMLRVAAQLGLDVKAFDACLAAPGMADAVKAETAEGQALGLEAGPSVVIYQGDKEIARFTGAISTPAVTEAIDALKK
jgi:protein-disulfide isomerase